MKKNSLFRKARITGRSSKKLKRKKGIVDAEKRKKHIE